MKTPATLREAIENGRCSSIGDAQRHVVDFLAQKFGTAYLKYGNNSEVLGALQDLYSAITTEPRREQTPMERIGL